MKQNNDQLRTFINNNADYIRPVSEIRELIQRDDRLHWIALHPDFDSYQELKEKCTPLVQKHQHLQTKIQNITRPDSLEQHKNRFNADTKAEANRKADKRTDELQNQQEQIRSRFETHFTNYFQQFL